MCIFSQPVVAVNTTQIFARRTRNDKQFLVYQMKYESAADNAMILPIPVRTNASEESLRFISLETFSNFFDDLAAGFPHRQASFQLGCSSPNECAADARLTVHEVGNYVASFVPTLKDFDRLDERFALPQTTWEKVPQYLGYGFAVFQLAAGALKPHPMAFEFETADDAIYFPTLHIHDGEVHQREKFDHALYLQHAGFDSRVHAYENFDVQDKSTGWIRSNVSADEFLDVDRTRKIVDGNLLVHRQFIRGLHPNQDTIVSPAGDPEVPTINPRFWMSYSPWIIGSAVLAWFFARRSKLKSDRKDVPEPRTND